MTLKYEIDALKLDKLKLDFNLQSKEKHEHRYLDVYNVVYVVNGFHTDPEATFIIRDDEDISKLRSFFEQNPYLFKKRHGFQIDGKIQIPIKLLFFGGLGLCLGRSDAEDCQHYFERNRLVVPFEYKENKMEVRIRFALKTETIVQYTRLIHDRFDDYPYFQNEPWIEGWPIIEILNYNKPSADGLEEDLVQILGRVLQPCDLEKVDRHYEVHGMRALVLYFSRNGDHNQAFTLGFVFEGMDRRIG